MSTVPRRILAANDFSATGEHAQEFALHIADRHGAELHVVHVQVLLDDPHLEDEHREEVDRIMTTSLDQKKDALRPSSSAHELKTRAHVVRGLSAAEAIVETCGDLGCDLIVVGTHGRRGLSHVLLGSVAENVVRSANVPVLTVRLDATVPTDGLRRILVPYDFSAHSAEAVRVAAGWARTLGAEITLFHAVEPVVYPEFYAVDLLPDEMIGRLRSRSSEALAAAAEELLEGVETTPVVRVGRAADAIIAEARPEDYDLVVMGTRGLSALEHLLLGSVVENVLRRCPVPLLAVRGGDDDAPPESG